MYVYMKAAYLSMLPDSEARPFGEDEVELFRWAYTDVFRNFPQTRIPVLVVFQRLSRNEASMTWVLVNVCIFVVRF